MKPYKLILLLMVMVASLPVFAQVKGEMPFSTTPEVNKLIRQALTLQADLKLEEANKLFDEAIRKDPECGFAYASRFAFTPAQGKEYIREAEARKLSADERLVVDGLKAFWDKSPNDQYFEPLVKKYPKDYHLQLMIINVHQDPLRGIAIGESLIKRNPKYAPAYNALGYAYLNTKNFAKAEQMFDKYIALRPELANVYDSKGDYLMEVNNAEAAIPMFEKAYSMGMTQSKEKAELASGLVKYPKTTEKDLEAIKGLIDRSCQNYVDGDIDQTLAAYEDQSIEIYADQRVNVGMPNIRRSVTGALENGKMTKLNFFKEAIEGIGTIAFALGKMEMAWKSGEAEAQDNTENVIFLLKQQSEGDWKILVDHFYPVDPAAGKLTPDEETKVRGVLDNWSEWSTGKVLSPVEFDRFAKLYSSQAIEIYPNQVANIGMGNLRARWKYMEGMKFEKNSLRTIGLQGMGRRAIAYGLVDQEFYGKDSSELKKMQYPWSMILTKEADDEWRILVLHWTR